MFLYTPCLIIALCPYLLVFTWQYSYISCIYMLGCSKFCRKQTLPWPFFLWYFILAEDGSSSCCCWASAERAATLLRLREELTTSHHLGRILKKHKKITVKSHGLSVDSPCQDHIFTVASGNALCSSDENILKFIICNACIGGIWVSLSYTDWK